MIIDLIVGKRKKLLKKGDKLYYNSAAKRKVGLKTTKRTKNDILIGYALSSQEENKKSIIIYKNDFCGV